MVHTDALRASHRQLSPVFETFMDACLAQPERISLFDTRRLPPLDAKYSYNAWPYFADAAFKEKVVAATETVMRLFPLIPERVFGGDMAALADVFDFASVEDAEVVVKQPNGMDSAMGRPDFLLTRDGFKCLETNTSPILGGTITEVLSQCYLSQDYLKAFLEEQDLKPGYPDPILRYLDFFYALGSRTCDGQELVAANMVRKLMPGAKMDPAFDRFFREYYLKQGLDITTRHVLALPYPEGLTIREDRVFAGEDRVHLIIAEEIRQPEVLEVFRKGKVGLINSPAALLMSDKRCLALLSTYADSGRFRAEEAAQIQRYIPWSRLLRPGEVVYRSERCPLVELVRRQKDDFVLKRGQGRAGEHVLLGRDTEPAVWDKAVSDALAEGSWIVQEVLESLPFLGMSADRELVPHQIVWGFFCYGGTYAGTVLRAQKIAPGQGKINAGSGATVSTLWFI